MLPSAPVIDVFSDVACPWCYIGERRLFAALRDRPDVDAAVRWRPFQLQPQLPAEGVPWRRFAEAKFGGWERARDLFAHVAEAGRADGIAFDFEGIAAAVNTTDAHRLILFGRAHDAEWPVARALFRAYFEQGVNVSDAEALLEIAARTGLDRDAACAWLEGDAGRGEVEASQQQAQRMGISGVPFFIFGERFALSGAQPVEVFAQALGELAEAEAG